MRISKNYWIAFFLAIAVHFLILMLSMTNKKHERPVLHNDKREISTNSAEDAKAEKFKTIQAVSVDDKLVTQEINRLKEKQARQKQAELDDKKRMMREAEVSRKKLQAEQKRIAALKQEAAQLALAKKKQLMEEQKRLAELNEKKKKEEKELAELKEKQLRFKQQKELEAKKLTEIKNKKLAELARIESAKEQQIIAEIAKKQEEARALQAANEAREKAEMAGVVDKYKALIINAISQKWILPDNADSNMSSQFRIRLAPNGAVLDVSLIKSSGDSILDRSARAAIYKASPLPVPAETKLFNLFRDISLTVRPGNVRG